MKGLARDLGRLVDKARVKTDPEDLFAYAGDATYHIKRGKPDAVVLPETTEEVSKVLKYAFGRTIPVTPRGAGTGLSGGCTPLHGGECQSCGPKCPEMRFPYSVLRMTGISRKSVPRDRC